MRNLLDIFRKKSALDFTALLSEMSSITNTVWSKVEHRRRGETYFFTSVRGIGIVIEIDKAWTANDTAMEWILDEVREKFDCITSNP